MQQAIDEAGNIWEVDAQGNPVRFVGNANQQQGMQIKPADPTRQYDLQKAQADAAVAQANAATAGQMNQVELAKAQAELAKAQAGNTQGAKQGQRAANLRALQQNIARVRELYQQNLKGGFPNQATALVPDFINPALGQFDSAGAGLSETGLAAFRVPGVGSQSDAELRAFVDANRPSSTDSDLKIEEKLRNLETRLNATMQEMGIEQPQQDGPTILPRAAGAQADPGIGPAGVTSEGGLRLEQGLAGLPDAVANMVAQGSQPSEITAFLNQQYAPFGASVGPDMAAAIGTLVQRHRADPRAPVKSLSTGWNNFAMLPGRQESTTLGSAADTDVGNFVMHGANAATAGLPGYLAGDQGAAVIDASRQSRPLSSLGGDITGSVAGMLGIQGGAGALGRAGSLLTRGGGIGGDVAYGATRGAVEGGPTGAITGAAFAGVGNKVGSGLINTAGRVTRGVSSPAVNYLSERGIPLTLGQLLGNRGVTGKILNKIESAPVVGDMMAARRLDSIEGFNREAMRQAVEPVGGSVTTAGREGLDQAYGSVDQGYADALSGRQFSGNEPQFISEMGAAIQKGQTVPKLGEDFSYIMREDVAPMFDANGVLSGDRLQAALQGLRKARSSFAGQPMGNYAGAALTDAEQAITGMVSRQAPDVMPRLSAANKAYGNVSTLADAVNTAGNQAGIFTPAQLGRAAINNTKKFGGKRAAATGNVPFRELQEAGQEVLPSTIPDSGTGGRVAAMLLPASLGGAAAGGEMLNAPSSVTIPLGVLAALSSKIGARAAQKALTGRGDAAKKIGNALIRQKRRAGLFGAATTGAMVPQFSQ